MHQLITQINISKIQFNQLIKYPFVQLMSNIFESKNQVHTCFLVLGNVKDFYPISFFNPIELQIDISNCSKSSNDHQNKKYQEPRVM